jgi:hypothetical protein
VTPKRRGLGKNNFERIHGGANEKQNNSRVGKEKFIVIPKHD